MEDNRPWAFDDNPAWDAFEVKAEAAGLMLRPLWSTYSSDYPSHLPTRGHNVIAYLVLKADGTQRRTLTAIAIGNGPGGYQFMIDPPTLDHDNTIEWIGRMMDA